MPSFSDTASGLDRKSLKRPDQFQSGIGGIFNNLSKNTGALLGLSALVIALGAGGAYLASHGKTKESDARNAMFKARQSYDKELAALAVTTSSGASSGIPKETTDKKDSEKTITSPADPAEGAAFRKVDVESKFAESLKSYREVAEKFDGTRAAFESNLTIGDLFFNHGEAGKAVPYYEKAKGMASGKIEKAMSEYALGYGLEASGKPAEAIVSYEKALKETDTGLKGDILLAIARSHEAKQEKTQALATYDQVLTQLPNTEYAKTAEIFKARLQ